MKFITAPDKYLATDDEVGIFLAGGITGCPDWQSKVYEILKAKEKEKRTNLDGLVIYNPRQVNFDITNPNASEEQIKWEFERLERCDIFSMFFSKTAAGDQPICFYELGRNVVKMQERFPTNWKKRVLVSYEDGFKRWKDIEVQMRLAEGFNEEMDVKKY